MKLLVAAALFAIAFQPFLHAEDEGPRLTLRGEAELRVGLVFRVYEAAFHLEERAATPDWTGDVAKRLVLRYARDIPARRLIEAGN